MDPNKLKEAKKSVEEFFERAGLEVSLDVKPKEETTLSVQLKSQDPQLLIGEGGQTLAEIQHLLKLFLRKKTGEFIYIDLDINEYKEKKREMLKDLARSTADEVSLLKRERALPPMSASDRRIIHMELANREDVATESVGQGGDRRVVIRLKSLEEKPDKPSGDNVA